MLNFREGAQPLLHGFLGRGPSFSNISEFVGKFTNVAAIPPLAIFHRYQPGRSHRTALPTKSIAMLDKLYLRSYK